MMLSTYNLLLTRSKFHLKRPLRRLHLVWDQRASPTQWFRLLTNAAQNSSSSINLVADAVQHNVTSITNPPVGAVESSGSEILPSAPLFSGVGVPLGSPLSAHLKKIWAEEFVNFGSLLDTSPNLDKFALSITPPTGGNGSKTLNLHSNR